MHSRSRYNFAAFTALNLLVLALVVVSAQAQVKTRLSIATGGTGGVYYPLGGGLAAVMSKYLPGVEATAEVTTASMIKLGVPAYAMHMFISTTPCCLRSHHRRSAAGRLPAAN